MCDADKLTVSEYILPYDSTTVSTYSNQISEAWYGFNKAHDGLETTKLLSLYSVESRQPIAFTKQLFPTTGSACPFDTNTHGITVTVMQEFSRAGKYASRKKGLSESDEKTFRCRETIEFFFDSAGRKPTVTAPECGQAPAVQHNVFPKKGKIHFIFFICYNQSIQKIHNKKSVVGGNYHGKINHQLLRTQRKSPSQNNSRIY